MARRARTIVRRGKKTYIWTATLYANAAVDLSATASIILDADDWCDIGGFKRGGVLERIRGWLSFRATAPLSEPSAGGGAYATYISKSKSDVVAFNDPWLVGTYVSEDILWTDGGSSETVQGTGDTPFRSYGQKIYVDVRTRRKLVADDIIVHVFGEQANVSTEWDLCGVLRCLISEP